MGLINGNMMLGSTILYRSSKLATISGADTSFSLFTDLSENSLFGIYVWKRIA